MVRVAFADFTPGFNPENNFLINTLRKMYEVKVVTSSKDPVDILFYSCFGFKHYEWSADTLKVYYTGENDVPDFNECDYAISFYKIDFCGRHFRLPLFLLYPCYDQLVQEYDISYKCDDFFFDRGFCSVVVSSSKTCDPQRLNIIEKFNQYKTLASGGKYNNNVGGPVKDKIDFCRNYKFNLALENSIVQGYVTEKIVEAMAAHSVPIYWGSDDVKLDLNPESYININDFSSLDDAIEYIKQVDQDRELYMRYLNAPKFLPHSNPRQWKIDLQAFLSDIIVKRVHHASPFGLIGVKRNKQYLLESFYSHFTLRKLFKKWNSWFPANPTRY